MIAVVVLLIINVILFLTTREDERLTEVKEKYRVLREHLVATKNENFTMLYREIPIIAHTGTPRSIGYNTNKGVEIGLCIDGDANDIFHVLLHELAHCTVDEYSHSKHYWGQFDALKDIAVSIGIYEKIADRTPFCGKHIMDK